MNLTGDVSVSVAARNAKYLAPLSARRIQTMCASGVFKTAHKKGAGKNAQWFIAASEIIQHKLSQHSTLSF